MEKGPQAPYSTARLIFGCKNNNVLPMEKGPQGPYSTASFI